MTDLFKHTWYDTLMKCVFPEQEMTNEEGISHFMFIISQRLTESLNNSYVPIAKLIHFLLLHEHFIHKAEQTDPWWVLKDIFTAILGRPAEDKQNKPQDDLFWLINQVRLGHSQIWKMKTVKKYRYYE